MSNVTDLDFTKQITYMTLENGASPATGTTLMTTMFSITQIINAMNQRQWRFLKDTGCVATQETISAPASQKRYTLPNDYIDTLRLGYNENGGQKFALIRVDAWEIDNGGADWNYSSGTPTVWNESTMPTRALELAPIPSNSGTLSHLYVAVTAALTNAGVQLTVPDEFSWAVMYGTMADLFGSDGEGLDAEKAAYCESRYQMGVDLCRMMLEGARQ